MRTDVTEEPAMTDLGAGFAPLRRPRRGRHRAHHRRFPAFAPKAAERASPASRGWNIRGLPGELAELLGELTVRAAHVLLTERSARLVLTVWSALSFVHRKVLLLLRTPRVAAPAGFGLYIVLSAYAEGLMGTVLPGGLTVGVLLGLAQLVGFFALAADGPCSYRIRRAGSGPPDVNTAETTTAEPSTAESRAAQPSTANGLPAAEPIWEALR